MTRQPAFVGIRQPQPGQRQNKRVFQRQKATLGFDKPFDSEANAFANRPITASSPQFADNACTNHGTPRRFFGDPLKNPIQPIGDVAPNSQQRKETFILVRNVECKIGSNESNGKLRRSGTDVRPRFGQEPLEQ
jgi:hypothetical protein